MSVIDQNGDVIKFMECDTCRAKLGSPALCDGCLNNRWLADRLSEQIEKVCSHLRVGQDEKGGRMVSWDEDGHNSHILTKAARAYLNGLSD